MPHSSCYFMMADSVKINLQVRICAVYKVKTGCFPNFHSVVKCMFSQTPANCQYLATYFWILLLSCIKQKRIKLKIKI